MVLGAFNTILERKKPMRRYNSYHARLTLAADSSTVLDPIDKHPEAFRDSSSKSTKVRLPRHSGSLCLSLSLGYLGVPPARPCNSADCWRSLSSFPLSAFDQLRIAAFPRCWLCGWRAACAAHA